MNKKGFTLVELLAVIVILGLLVAIINPVVKNLLNDSKESLSKQQIEMVITATKKYMVEHSELLPDEDSTLAVDISDLINDGVIENDKVINPKTKEEINGCVVVSYSNEFNQYEYNYFDASSLVCESNGMIAYRNITTGSYYESLEDAFSSVRSGSQNTIRVVRNVTDASSGSPDVAEGKDILLDLNGHTVTMSNSILNHSTMKIIDSGITGTLSITGASNILLYNYNDLEITGGNFNSQYRCVRNANISQTLKISGGTFTTEGVSGNPYSADVLSLAGGNTIVTGGTFIAKTGTTDKSSWGIDLEKNTSAQLTIKGGTVKGDIVGIINNGSQTVANIYEGTSVTGSVSNGVKNALDGTVNIYGGTIISESSDAIANAGTGYIEIAGGTITGGTGKAGISLQNGSMKITGGSITGQSYGIWINSSNSPTLTFGTSDSTINSVPLITATNPTGNGVYVGTGSTFNFYDGTIIGGYSNDTGYSITGSGTINTPSGYSVSKSNNGAKETAVLVHN